MKIERVHIDGFGEYSNRSLHEFDHPVTVLYGPNEAGKSTLLAFIHMVLFGFPGRFAAEHFPPLAGGDHGGRLDIVTDAGDRYTVARRIGPKRGPVTITAPDGSLVPESALPSILGHASEAAFNSVFAFDLDALWDLPKDDDGGINSRIYTAGTGAAKLPEALRKLDSDADKIWQPRGSKQPVAKVLVELETIAGQLREAQGQSREYGETVAELEQLEDESTTVAGQLRTTSANADELRRRNDSWDTWMALMDARDRLAEIPELSEFPEDAVSRLNELERQMSKAEDEVSSAEMQLERAREDAGVAVDNEELLDHAKAVERIQLGRERFAASVADLPKRQASLVAKENDLARQLSDLGTGWDEGKLARFDISVPRREEVRQWGTKLVDATTAARNTTNLQSTAENALVEATRDQDRALSRLEAVPAPELTSDRVTEQRAAVRSARNRLTEFEVASQRARDLEAQAAAAAPAPQPVEAASSGLVLPIILAVLGLSFLVASLVLTQWLAAIGGTVMLLAAGAAWYFANRSTTQAIPPQQVRSPAFEDAHKAAEIKRQSLVEAAAPLNLNIAIGDLPGRDHLDTAEEALDQAAERLRQRTGLQRSLDDARELVELRTEQHKSAEEDRERHLKAEQRATTEWREWLRAQELSEELTPGTTLELLSIAETAREVADSARDIQSRVDGIEKDIEDYRSRVVPLAERHLGPFANDQPSTVGEAADSLVRRLAQAKEASEDQADALRHMKVCEAQLADLEKRRGRVEEELAALLAKGGTSDAEEFRRRAAADDDRQRLLVDEREQTAAMRGVWGRDVDLAALGSAFAEATREETRERLAAAQSRLADLGNLSDEMNVKKGKLKNSRDTLSAGREASELRAQREELTEQLRAHAAQWSKLVVARSLLQRARKKYERERQPDVVRHAQGLFETLTGGRYTNLHSALGEDSITVLEHETGRSKTPNQLSRGTREQLFLALRFGLIQSMGEKTERLPIVVDEILVNFDPERAGKAAEAFVELSRTNQVLVLTCHPGMRDLFVEATGGQAKVINLEDIRS